VQLAGAIGLNLTSRPSNADTIVLAHGTVGSTISDEGEIRLGFRPKTGASLKSERSFREQVGILGRLAEPEERPYYVDQIAKHGGLNASQIRTLDLYDVLSADSGRFSYADLVAARAVGQLFAAGARFPKIVAAALSLEQSGISLSGARLAKAPWGEVLRVFEGALAEIDGQLLLPIQGSDVDAEKAFARAEASEREGDSDSARRWYDLAARLDREDPVIPFNLGNVLDELGRGREAEIAYRRAIARSPALADAWFNLGVLQEKSGRDEEALSSYQGALAAEPTYADALHNAALLLMRRRRFADALSLLNQIIALSEGGAEAKRLAHLCRLELMHQARSA